jgi:nitrogen fixation NifU-like protein
MTPYGATILEHFRRPRNHAPLAMATASAEGTNPLCGDRVRIELRVENGIVREAGFTANACAICTAAASLLTERVRGATVDATMAVTDADAIASLESEVPPARERCATLPLRTMRLALAADA